MLHTETVEPRAFSLLKQLMELPALENFSLVGGTALSLIYGHRKSVDLDLFCDKPFENAVTVAALQDKFSDGFVVEQKPIHFGIFAFIDTIKTDLAIQFHQEKYKQQQLLISVPQAITYFADAEEDQDPVSLDGQTWENVKAFINEKVSDYLA